MSPEMTSTSYAKVDQSNESPPIQQTMTNGSVDRRRKRNSQTPADRDFYVANRRLSRDVLWTLIQSAFKIPDSINEGEVCDVIEEEGSEEEKTKLEIKKAFLNATSLLPESLQSQPDYLHVLALHNRHCDIRHFADVTDNESDAFIEACLKPDSNGNLPAMIAAIYNHKEALLQLLAPFITSGDASKIERLVHHTNARGQRLLGLVVHHRQNLLVAHGILVEFEALAHGWDSRKVKACFRDILGSTAGAADTLHIFEKIDKKEGSSLLFSQFLTFVKIFSFAFLFRFAFLVFDLYTDVHLLKDYYTQWTDNNSEPARDKTNVCGQNQSLLVEDNYNMTNIDDKIWEPFEIPPRTRFLVTLILIFLPTIFNLFELLRFRLASLWIEDVVPKMCTNPVWQFFIIFVAKSVANFFLLLTWLSVSLVRNFWFRFRFETSRTSKKIGPHRKSTRLARTVAIRAQLIKGCTEASLQPLFQLYLLFNQFQTHSVSDVFIGSTEHYRYRQMVSVIISILALAISFTVNYRENKENSLGIVQTVCYLTYIIMSVVARTVCFEIYAFYLGPSWHWLIVAISCHVAVMTLLHFIFSDSYVQCLRSKSARQVMLVLHNCFVNGLANLYIHNNLEIFVRITDQGEASKMTSVEIENSQNKRKGSQGISMLKPTYGPIDIQQRTLVRQLFVDIIIFVENVSMVVIARQTMCQDLYLLSVKIIVVAYLAAIILKIAFYLCCHPWAELIRPHFANHPDENWKDNPAENLGQNREGHREGDQEENPDIIKEDSPDGVVKKHVVTSSVVLGRRVNIVVEGKYLRLERDDYKRDYLRHQSIEFGNIHSK